MRVLIQRVSRGSVTVAGETVGSIEQGLVILVGIAPHDDRADVAQMAKKVTHLRIFTDENGRFNHSLLDTGGGALVVSQFTLYADTRRGRRPSFTNAAPPEQAEPLIDYFAKCLEAEGVARVENGRFGASMSVELCNEGPVTIWLDGDEGRKQLKT